MRPLVWHWRRWRRRVPVFWVFSLVLAAVTGVAVYRFVAVAEARAAALGSVVRVPVVARVVGTGSAVAADDVSWRPVPRAFLPSVRVAVAPVVGRVALSPLLPGEVVVEDRLAPSGLRGAAALVPPGMRAVSVRAESAPRLEVGDRVDVVAGAGAGVVARAALVVEVGDETVTVAVSAADVPSVASAVGAGPVTLALIGGSQ